MNRIAKTDQLIDYLEIEFAIGYCENPMKHQEMFYPIITNSVNWKDLQCELCLDFYTSKTGLKSHQRLHENDDIYYCEKCEFRTVIDEELGKHRYYHFAERCFQCLFCVEEFVNPDTLNEHNCIRLGDHCSVCSLPTVKFSHSIVHLKTCGKKKIKPFRCKFCHAKEFKVRCHLVDHTDRHLDFNNYSIKYDLTTPKQSSLYKSSICSYTSNVLINTRGHEKRHVTSKRRLSCM